MSTNPLSHKKVDVKSRHFRPKPEPELEIALATILNSESGKYHDNGRK